MAKIIGESYFMLKQYKEAIPLPGNLSDPIRQAYTIHDRYQLAFAYYSNQEYENARKLI